MSKQPENKTSAKSAKSDQPKPKKKRWLLKTVLALVILLVLLIALAPMIASSGFGEGMVASAISKSIDGSVEFDDLSVGWFSGTRIDGLVLKDPAGEVVLRADVAAPDVKLLALLRGSRALGEVTITATEATIEQYADGTTNLGRAIGGGEESSEEKPLSIPSDLSVDLTLTAPLVTYRAPGAAPAELTDVKYTTTIANPSQIAASLASNLKRGDMSGNVSGDVTLNDAFNADGELALAGATIKANLSGKAAGKVKTTDDGTTDGSADLQFTATYTGESNRAVADGTLEATVGGESGKVAFNGTLDQLLNDAGELSDQVHGSGSLEAQNFAMSIVDGLLGTPGAMTEQVGRQLNATAKFNIPQGGERGTVQVDAEAENMNADLDLALNLLRQEGALQRVTVTTTDQPSTLTVSAATANKFVPLPSGFKEARIADPVKTRLSHVLVDMPIAADAEPMRLGLTGEIERLALTGEERLNGTTVSNVKVSLPDGPVTETTKATFSGTLAQGQTSGPFNGEVNLVRQDGATQVSGEAHFNNVPPAVADAVANQDGHITKTFNPAIEKVDLTFSLNQETNTLDASLDMTDSRGKIETVAVTLKQPTLVAERELTENQKKSSRVVLMKQWKNVELKVTPQLWEAYGSALNPAFKAVSGSQPIRVMIAENSFVYPLTPDEAEGVTPEEGYGLRNAEADVSVELGTLTLEKSGPLATILGVLGHFVKEFQPAAQNEWTATFSPVKARLKDGKLVYQEPMNMVMDFGGRQLHLAFDGNVDIANNKINLDLVIGKETFKGIKEIYAAMEKTNGLTIPLSGTMSTPSFDKEAFTKNIAGLAIQAGLSRFGGEKINDALGGDAANIIKGVEGILGGNKGEKPNGDKTDPLGDLLKGVGGALNKDKDKKDGASKDGATKDGATKDGATKDGATKDGASKDGAAKSDATKDGAKRDPAGDILKGVGDLLGGSKKDDAKKDGATKDGATKDGAAKDGATKDDATKEGAAKDGAKSKEDASKDGESNSGADAGQTGDAKADEKKDEKKDRVNEALKGIDSIFGGDRKKESDKK